MHGLYVSRTTAPLVKSPNLRQQAARRRTLAICGVLVLATASGVVGAMTHRDGADAVGKPHTGAFSYFPSE
jgi:hypothetical protein